MSSYCRLCLEYDKTFADVSELQAGKSLTELIKLLFKIQILPNDKHSKSICEECLEIVVSAYQLRQKSIANQDLLPFQKEVELTAVKCEKDETFEPPQQVELDFVAIKNETKDGEESESFTNQPDDQPMENVVEQNKLEVPTTVVQAEEEDAEMDHNESNELMLPYDLLQVKLEEGEKENERMEEENDDDVIIETPERRSLRPHRPQAVIPRTMKRKNVTFACPKCAETFETLGSLSSHHNKAHNDLKLPHKCRLCNNQFYRSNELQQHNLIHDMDALASSLYERGQEDGFRCCSVCSETFLTLSNLKEHWNEYHDTVKNPFSCAYCLVRKTSERLIVTHILKDHRSISNDGQVVLIKDRDNMKTVKVGKVYVAKKTAVFVNPIDAYKNSEEDQNQVKRTLDRLLREKKAASEIAHLSRTSKSSSSKGRISKAKRRYTTKFTSNKSSSSKSRCPPMSSSSNSRIGSFEGVITIESDSDDDNQVVFVESNEDPFRDE